MKKTTVYFPDALSADLKRAARGMGRSEADLIREGVRRVVAESIPPKPTLPLFASGDPALAERVDELLEGFGKS